MSTRIRGTLPPLLQLVPDLGSPDFEQWCQALATTPESSALTATTSGTLEPDLRALAEAMLKASTDRTWFVLVPPEPFQPAIAAVGWLELRSAGGRSATEVRATLLDQSRIVPGSALLSDAIEVDLPGMSAVVIHQLRGMSSGVDSDPSQLVERCTAVAVDDSSDSMLYVELYALDLRAFDDITAVVISILKSVQFSETSV